MSGTQCHIVDANSDQPAARPVWWVCLWTAWGALGGTALIALDHDWVAATIWFMIGGTIGTAGPMVGRLVGRVFFETVERKWENPHELHIDPRTFEVTCHEEWATSAAAKAGLFVAPAFALFYGFLLGPFLGVLASWERAKPGWSGALEGLAICWTLISIGAAVVTAVLCRRVLGAGPKSAPPRWMYLASPLYGVLGILNCIRALLHLPRQRRILREFTNRGAVFGWDGISIFHGINFRGGSFADDDLNALRFFPNLDQLNLAGTHITDAGMARIARLKRLRGLDLSRTRITDDAMSHLLRLTRLRYLTLHTTAVTEEATAALRVALPRCEISR